ncbi:YebO family protein [Providencia manganoxydans]|uniref:YebO family protein n=1 Tax=Providencia manganoxydans TaxID=2923283 RepID=UPI0032DB440F
MGPFLIANIVIAVISVLIWFFLNRASVRANRLVELLELIDKKNNKQIELLSLILESNSISLDDNKNKQLLADYFREAKLIGDNLILSDGKLNKDNVIKFAEYGNKYIESEKLKGENIDNSIDLFTMLKNEKFSKLTGNEKEIANKLYKDSITFL